MPRTRQKIPGVFTRGKNPLNFARNGSLCFAQSMSELAAYANMIAGKRRRILFNQQRRPLDVTGVTGTRVAFRARIRPSYQSGAIRAELVCIPADTSTGGVAIADSPYVQIHTIHSDLSAGGGGLGTRFRRIYLNRRDTGTIVPDDYFLVSQRLTANNIEGGYKYLPVYGADYNLEVVEANWARIISCCIYEEQAGSLERQKSTDFLTGTTPQVDVVTGTGGTAEYLLRADETWDSSYVGGRLVLSGLPSAANDGEFPITNVDTSGKRLYFVNNSAVGETFDTDSSFVIKDRTAGATMSSRVGADIIAPHMADVNELLHRIHKDGGGHLFAWSAEPGALLTHGSATYTNPFDSTTAASASSTGFWLWPENMGTLESNSVPIVFWAYLRRASGASAVNCRLVGATSGTIATVSINSGTAAYVTATGVLNAALAAEKFDIHLSGNGTDSSCEVHSFGAYRFTA